MEVILKWRDIYIENIRMVPLKAGLKMEGIVKWRGLKSQGPLYGCERPSWCLCEDAHDMYYKAMQHEG